MSTSIQSTGRAARSPAIWILSDNRERRRTLVAMVRGAPNFAGFRVAATALPIWLRLRERNAADLVLYALDATPEPRDLSAIDSIARTSRLIVLAPRHAIGQLERVDWSRGLALIAHEELSIGAMQTLARTLEGGRASEQRLIGALAERNHVVSRLKQSGERLASSAERMGAQWRQVANATEAEFVRRLASDAVEALAEASRDVVQHLSEAQPEIAARGARLVDLNRTVDEIVASLWDARELPIYSLTSRHPVLVDVDPETLRRFLQAMARSWKARRTAGERWEWIVWDAGDTARLAAIVSREPRSELQLPLAVTLRECLMETTELAGACAAMLDGPVAADPESHRVALTFSLPKHATDVPAPLAVSHLEEASASDAG